MMGQTQNVAQVALEAGNSPRMIFQHYRELVQRKEAKQWFEIMPKGEAKRGGKKAEAEPENVVEILTERAA